MSGKDQDMAQTETVVTALTVRDDGEFANLLDSARFSQLQRVAKLFSSTDLVPVQFKGNMAACFVAMQMALRMEIDPMALMQNMYVVHGKPGLEAKMVIALVNKRGPFTGPIQWRENGSIGKPGYTCTAFAVHKETGDECSADVSHEMVKAEGWEKNKKWITMPQLMYRYRSASHLARLYCPEVIMGMNSIDELVEMPKPEPVTVTIDKAEPAAKAKDILRQRVEESIIDAVVEPESEKPKVEITDNTMDMSLDAIQERARADLVPEEMIKEFRMELGIFEEDADTHTKARLAKLQKKIVKFVG